MSAFLTEIDYSPNSAMLFEQMVDLPWAIFLDSCQPYSQQGRYDILSACPYRTLSTRGGLTTLDSAQGVHYSHADPLTLLHDALETDTQETGLPFNGGALGYFSYDLARRLEHLPTHTLQDIALPEMAIGIYDWALLVDHLQQRSYLVQQNKSVATTALLQKLRERWKTPIIAQETPFQLLSPFVSSMTKKQYADGFLQIKQHLQQGDCYQINFAQRFSASYTGSLWLAYKLLREQNPVPYAAYLHHPEHTILSLSPERFLQVQQGDVTTKPIKGTRPRHADPRIDQQLADALLNSTKDRAENLMIVDLLRNDLHKHCQTGSVQVPELFALESFPNVHHLVSTITGKLAEGKHSVDLLRASFPGGSITGAPKIRAMHIIEELEIYRRAIYCGSIGYISHHGNMDTNIAIRTLLATDATLYCSAGGGIVADSELEAEYQETLTKVEKILQLLK